MLREINSLAIVWLVSIVYGFSFQCLKVTAVLDASIGRSSSSKPGNEISFWDLDSVKFPSTVYLNYSLRFFFSIAILIYSVSTYIVAFSSSSRSPKFLVALAAN